MFSFYHQDVFQSPGVWKSHVHANDNHWSHNYVAPHVTDRYRHQYSASSVDQQEASNIGYVFGLIVQYPIELLLIIDLVMIDFIGFLIFTMTSSGFLTGGVRECVHMGLG